MSADRFNDGYAAAEAHWKKRWYAANADHQAAVTEVEALRQQIETDSDVIALLRDESDALAARLAAVEALADETERAGDPLLRLDRLRAALSAAPTDTTKET